MVKVTLHKQNGENIKFEVNENDTFLINGKEYQWNALKKITIGEDMTPEEFIQKQRESNAKKQQRKSF